MSCQSAKAITSMFEKMQKGRSMSDVDILRKDWIEKIHAGQALKYEDEILKLIDLEAANSKLSLTDILHSQQATDTYKRLMVKYRKAKPKEIPWLKISNSFYKLALICKLRTGQGEKKWDEWELSIRNQYQELRRIIGHDMRESAYSAILPPLVFIAVFTALNLGWSILSGETLGQQLVFWRAPVLWVGVAFIVNGIIRVLGASFAHWAAEKTRTELDDVSAIISLLSTLATTIFLLAALDILTGPASPPFELGPFITWLSYETANISRTLVIILVATWSLALIVNRLTENILNSWASANRQAIDEVIIRISQLITMSLVIAIGIVVMLMIIEDPIRKAIGTDLTNLLSIFAAIIVAVVGFIFENLLGGISLQIEKPFEIGNRIELPDGRLCEVVSLGLRRTLLRNVEDTSEIAIPNAELARWSITNTSRMDSSRIIIRVWIADPSQIKLAQEILLDIAYLEKEIDQMRVFESDLRTREHDKTRKKLSMGDYRITIEKGMERLVMRYINIHKAIVSQIVGGGQSEPEYIFDITGNTQKDPYRKVLKELESSRQNYQRIVMKENEWLSQGARRIAGDMTNEMLQNYRRAVDEIVYSESIDSQSALGSIIHDVALREHLDVEKLSKALHLLAGAKSIKSSIGKSILDKLRIKLKEFESERLGIVFNIGEDVATLENYMYAIGEQHPDVQPDLDGILGEMVREPSVTSEYSENGYVQLTLNCYALYLERRLEIQHKINREIGWRFKNAGIKFSHAV
jgi:small-conductance mechanosensitive channel